MIKKIVLSISGVLLVGVLGIVGVALTQPDVFHVEREMTMKATPAQIYPHISNLKAWEDWSPWEEKDPQMKKTYSGPESGVGARQEWKGNSDVGSGSIEITDVEEPTRIKLNLHFIEPFEGDSKVTFNIVPEGDDTKVTWKMDSQNDFVSKVMMVFMDMDEMCGNDFDRGLMRLKEIVETKSRD